jgi:hypothetical protein
MDNQKLSDAEVQQLLSQAEVQLEEYIRLGQLAVETRTMTVGYSYPAYSWDNPVGLVMDYSGDVVLG